MTNRNIPEGQPDPQAALLDAMSDDETLAALGSSDAERPLGPVEHAIREAGLDTILPTTPMDTIEALLRRYAKLVNGATPLRRQALQVAASRHLAAAKVPGASRLVAAALAAHDGDHGGAVRDGDHATQGSALALADPVPWPEPVNGAALLSALVKLYARFVRLPSGGATVAALWTVHAYALDAFQVSPVLALTSPEKRCGKTTLLTLLGALVPRPLPASNITAAVVFRAVEKFRPTLLVDEMDTFLNGNDELRGLLNSGHHRAGAVVLRNVPVGDGYEPRAFSTWCPKALACIGALPATLTDRALVLPMRRRRPEEHVDRLRLDRLPTCEPMRRRAWRWTQDHLDALKAADPVVPDGLHDRAADNWRPLLAVADVAGGIWPERARRAARHLSAASDEGDQAPAVQLLADLRALFADRGVAQLKSADIVAALVEREDRPWPEWRGGRPLTVRQLARLLERFGIRPKQLWIAGKNQRGYERDMFDDAFARYLPGFHPLGPVESSKDATKSAADDPVGGLPLSDSEPRENPHHSGVLAVLPDGKGEPGAKFPVPARGDTWEPEP